MSQEYKAITDRIISILKAYQSGKLSEDLSQDVTDVRKGQYIPTGQTDKPIVFVRFRRPGAMAGLAGGKVRQERGMFVISGATWASTQDDACDEATNLLNNVEQIMQNHAAESGWWSGSHFGWGYSEQDASPAVFADVFIEPSQDGCIAHFQMLWSCDFRIATDTLTGGTDVPTE
jgi:hypothetical protein